MGPHVSIDEESKFSFPKSQDMENSVTSNTYAHASFSSPSILHKPNWPQSYERSMSFYSRSLPLVAESSFGELKDGLLQVSSDHFFHEHDNGWEDAEVPLLSKDPVRNIEDTIQGSQENLSQIKAQVNADEHVFHVLKPQRSSVFQAILNGVNMLAGVGILSMPYAVAQGGWIGLSFLLIFACVCCYTGVLLRRCLDVGLQIHGYPDVGEAAFGKFGRILVSSLLYLELYAVAVEFLILEGDNLTQLTSWEGFSFGMLQLSPEKSFIILSALVMLPTVWLRDLSLMSYISAGGVIASIVVMFAVAWVGVLDIGFTSPGPLLKVQGLPIAVGLYAFCYCGHAVFPNIYRSMDEKAKFSHVLVVCFIVCSLIYGGMAVLGILMFGDGVKSQVTLSLPRGVPATQVAIIATLVNPFAKYALTVTPLAAALEELLPYNLKARNFRVWGTIIRTMLVASTVVVALTVPFFAYLMALVGSFLSTTVAITIPCVCYLKLFSGRVSLWESMLVYMFTAVGFCACMAGTYSSVLEIVKSLSSK